MVCSRKNRDRYWGDSVTTRRAMVSLRPHRRQPTFGYMVGSPVALVGLLLLVACGGPTPIPTPSTTATPSIAATPSATPTSAPPLTATSPPITATTPLPTEMRTPPTATLPLTATAPATPILVTPAAILYAADFATWFAGEENDPLPFRAAYDQATSEYHLALTDAARGYIYYRYAPEGQGFADFQLDIEARRVAGPMNGGSYGVVFRAQPGATGDRAVAQYNFFVTADGTFALNLLPLSGPATSVVPRSASPAINTGTASNRLTVICRGASITLAINGQTVGTFEAVLQGAGAVGLYVANPANPSGPVGMEAAFKNLRVTALPSASSTGPSMHVIQVAKESPFISRGGR